ncbi:hypothetical protein DMC30DRAFT_398809 [Rhodotorula diobovata]|uniref:Uncharacterized protein n=1 Tax=Rhodotorula diobovata TaxID=5288 RepID=A0A5C5FT78_9BASI|nr:hypothetical protein DMC30DRAFT_398809 [Rhodotorula diobovata]
MTGSPRLGARHRSLGVRARPMRRCLSVVADWPTPSFRDFLSQGSRPDRVVSACSLLTRARPRSEAIPTPAAWFSRHSSPPLPGRYSESSCSAAVRASRLSCLANGQELTDLAELTRATRAWSPSVAPEPQRARGSDASRSKLRQHERTTTATSVPCTRPKYYANAKGRPRPCATRSASVLMASRSLARTQCVLAMRVLTTSVRRRRWRSSPSA